MGESERAENGLRDPQPRHYATNELTNTEVETGKRLLEKYDTERFMTDCLGDEVNSRVYQEIDNKIEDKENSGTKEVKK